MRQLTAQRDAGLRVILVTGRCLEDLDRDFADVVAAVEAVVAENGALLRIDGEVEELQPPVSTQVRDALGRAGITFRPGRVILDCRADDALAIAGILGDLGSDVQAIRNRGQLMLLPAGVTKASGLAAALHALGISPHNTMAVGDAENDLAMLHLAEVAVAVANALPAVLEAADLVLPLEAGAGVQSLLTHPILTGEARMTIPRRDLRIGETAAGQPVTVPAADANILITGESGSGKSHLARHGSPPHPARPALAQVHDPSAAGGSVVHLHRAVRQGHRPRLDHRRVRAWRPVRGRGCDLVASFARRLLPVARDQPR